MSRTVKPFGGSDMKPSIRKSATSAVSGRRTASLFCVSTAFRIGGRPRGIDGFGMRGGIPNVIDNNRPITLETVDGLPVGG